MRKITTIIFYPFLVIFSIFTAIYLIIRSCFFSTKSVTNFNTQIEEKFSIYIENYQLKIYRIYAGEIRMGPEYYGLKSEPKIQEIESGIYGDWFYKTETGIYLQKWNSIKVPNTDLIFIDFKNLNVLTIKSNIQSVNWKIEKKNGELIFSDYIGSTITIV